MGGSHLLVERQTQIKKQSRKKPEDSFRFNKGGYVKQLVTKLKENK